MSDHRVKISVKSDHHALQNLSSNPTDKVTEFDSRGVIKELDTHKNPLKNLRTAKVQNEEAKLVRILNIIDINNVGIKTFLRPFVSPIKPQR